MSRRLKITLSDAIIERLEELAAANDEPISRVTAQIVREHLPVPPQASSGLAEVWESTPDEDDASNPRPVWLEPYGGDRDWRSEMWGSIVTLHSRYPRVLAALKEGWWESEAHVEMLCALVVWRAGIDEAARDPREELTFHAQLLDFGGNAPTGRRGSHEGLEAGGAAGGVGIAMNGQSRSHLTLRGSCWTRATVLPRCGCQKTAPKRRLSHGSARRRTDAVLRRLTQG